ncbi:MAG TPA: hypothetical protein VID50_05280 [Candidatus Eisenbacteria bacterium]
MPTADPRPLPFDAARHLTVFQPLLALPRETVPQLTVQTARQTLSAVAGELQLELIETDGIAPIFLLLPPAGAPPTVLLFETWHAESAPVAPAALEGAERLALAVSLAALAGLRESGADGSPLTAAVAVAPAASHGSRPLAESLTRHRERLRSGAAFWIRVGPSAPRRRRVLLGSRGRVVLGLWGEGPNPYEIRDAVVGALAQDAYGPRPLDFELLRKLAGSGEAMLFLEETLADPGAAQGTGEARLRNVLFEPRGHVLAPAARHPDRPFAWLTFETAEGMEAAEILARVEALARGARVEMAESFPWDRIGIHHPAVQTAIAESKERSEGPEIWPMAPWSTPSGVFTRALGVPLMEWGVPLPSGGEIRFPTTDSFHRLVGEATSLLGRFGGREGRSPRG